MSTARKTNEARDKDLRLAISRIEHGRAHTQATQLTIASVAREAGVSTALIHNCHPAIAETIREAQGRASRAQRDAKHQELKAEREKARILRDEITMLRAQVAKLASINEVLLAEIRALKALRIPRKLDGRSMANWTPVPRQSGQAERSDAGVESVYSWMGSSVNVG